MRGHSRASSDVANSGNSCSEVQKAGGQVYKGHTRDLWTDAWAPSCSKVPAAKASLLLVLDESLPLTHTATCQATLRSLYCLQRYGAAMHMNRFSLGAGQ